MATPKYDSTTKTWSIRACIIDSDGKMKRKFKAGFPNKTRAVEWQNEWINKSRQNTYSESTNTYDLIDMLLYEKEFIEKKAQSTLSFYEENFAVLKKLIGDVDINKLTVTKIQSTVNSLIDTPRKCKSFKQCLSLLFNYAERVDALKKNIIKKINFPAYRAKETAHYDLDKFKNLLQILMEANSYAFTAVYLMGAYGLRPSEALALTEDDIKNNKIAVSKAKVEVKRANKSLEQIISTTKTAKSTRTIPIDDEAKKIVCYYKNKNKIYSDYLCCSTQTSSLTQSQLSHELSRIIDKYSLPHITPYGLRHTFGQIQKQLHTDIYTISTLMGHSNIQTTTKTYFHNDNLLEKNAIGKITSAIKIQL